MSRRLRWLAVAAVALLLVGLGAATFGVEREGRWLRVERRDLVSTVEVEGELEAVESLAVGPPQVQRLWNFKISFLATEGSRVEAGEPVVGFDATELRRRLQKETTDRDTARKELEKREVDAERNRRDLELRRAEAQAKLRRALFALEVPEEVVSRAELEKERIDRDLAQYEIDYLEKALRRLDEQIRLDLASLRARADRAASAVAELEASIESMRVKAPRAGTVVLLEVSDGKKFSVGDSIWKGGKVVEIPDLGHMRAVGTIAEATLGRVDVGDEATLRLDAFPDRTFHAEVSAIVQAVQRKSAESEVKVARVRLELGETDEALMRPGMRFRGAIETERKNDALTVPAEAIYTDPEGAWVLTRGLFGNRRVRPKLGQRDDKVFEVLDGLTEGDRVLARHTEDVP
ncbi:MAG: efflux RND transporter periplasmic adaptor subunit [Acidobacteriota bacterium]